MSTTEVQQLGQLKSALTAQVKDLKAQLEKAQLGHDLLQTKANDLQKEIKALEKRLIALEAQILSKTKTLSRQKLTLATNTQKALGDKRTLAEEVKRLERRRQLALESLQTQQEALQHKEKELAHHQEALDILERGLDEERHRLIELTGVINDRIATVQEIEAKANLILAGAQAEAKMVAQGTQALAIEWKAYHQVVEGAEANHQARESEIRAERQRLSTWSEQLKGQAEAQEQKTIHIESQQQSLKAAFDELKSKKGA